MTELSRQRRNLIRLEFVITLILVLVLIAVAIDRIKGLMSEAERIAFETSLTNLQTGIGNAMVERVIAGGGPQGIAALADTNPMDYAEPPSNYRGAQAVPNAALLEKGSWTFNTLDHTLVYRPRGEDGFDSVVEGTKRARFRIRLNYVDENHDGVFDPATDRFLSLSLEPVDAYRWETFATGPVGWIVPPSNAATH